MIPTLVLTGPDNIYFVEQKELSSVIVVWSFLDSISPIICLFKSQTSETQLPTNAYKYQNLSNITNDAMVGPHDNNKLCLKGYPSHYGCLKSIEIRTFKLPSFHVFG